MTRALVVAVASVFLGAGFHHGLLEPDRIAEAAHAVMTAARYCALITLDADGAPQARAMDPFPADSDFRVWMATNKSTRKVRELANDSRATLYYLDASSGAYVTLTGVARVITDADEKARRWKPEWDEFYVEGNRGDDYVLVRFVAHRVEVVSPAHGVASDPRAWKPAILELER